jgi:hypothetical protein
MTMRRLTTMRPLLVLVGLAALHACAPATAARLPAPWAETDLSAGQLPGSAAYDAGGMRIQGTMDLWGIADGGHLVWQRAAGESTLTACVASLDNPGAMIHAKASLSIRASLAPGAKQVTFCVTAGDGTQFLYRDLTDAKAKLLPASVAGSAARVAKAHFPCWLRIVRQGTEISAFESSDGESWTASGQITLDLGADAVIGLSASSHKPDVLATATFTHIAIAVASPAGH